MKTTTLAAYPGITFTRVANGEFNCYAGTILTPFKIVNGSQGLSGRNTANVYGVYTGDGSNTKWLGPLRTAKMFAAAKAKTWVVKKAFEDAMSAGIQVENEECPDCGGRGLHTDGCWLNREVSTQPPTRTVPR